ncbi:Na+/H+ antiporter family protein [Halanaerobium hydrogeniformans]|uniref:Na+/H+ antiporter NhaC-like protein n=1 Tax=Halanaerobium hydrogeniformans TaxID=656519 RepID=E4RLW7_HALHG|nr:Na+/H+ antiporter family protein [Halanaerobium hydrogeniformans]ADQ14589.1 Na+/H+ antiporter NhaC-like protein [Halanaerobium hydrogeniformans]
MLTNPVVISVIVMTVLSLLKLNVILALIMAAIVGGTLSGLSIGETMSTLVNGMGGNAETALSYILLGALAASIHKTGLAALLAKNMARWMKGKGTVLILIIAFVASLSQNLIPVHIAFIPILIPPLIGVMNKLKIDRRAVAVALTFGLKAPYLALPVGFGLIFHNIIRDQMIENGMEVTNSMITSVMWVPALGMVVGLILAVFFTYKSGREYKSLEELDLADKINGKQETEEFNSRHFVALVGAVAALAIQLLTDSLPLGAIVALTIMLVFRAIQWKDIDELVNEGIGMMGFIAFVMLVASGYGEVIRETGQVAVLVENASALMGGSSFVSAFIMVFVGLIVTMGIGTSFGTIPILAVIYVPLATATGFSPLATIALIGTAAALGDAGSPASDSTLGPSAGLDIDGQHDHIWDTCVPTFIHFNIPIMIFGIIAALVF